MSGKTINTSLLINAMKPVFVKHGLTVSIKRQQEMSGGLALFFNVTDGLLQKSRSMTVTVSEFIFTPPLPDIQEYDDHAIWLARTIADRYRYLEDQERVIKALLNATPEQIAVLKLLGEKGGRVELPDAENINPRGISSFLNHVEEHATVYPQLQPFLPFAQLQRANLITIEPFGLFSPYAQFTNLGYSAYWMIRDEVAIRVIDRLGDDMYTALKKGLPALNFTTTVQAVEWDTPPVRFFYEPPDGKIRVEFKRWRSWADEEDIRIGFSPELNTLFVAAPKTKANAE